MKRQQAFKYELMPDGTQKRLMRRFAGCCRFTYNRALELQQERRSRGETRLGYTQLCREITAWRNAEDTAWLAQAPVHPLQQAMKDLGRAYENFFEGRASFPRFRKRGRHDSFRYPDPKQITLDEANSRLFLPKLGWLRYRNSRTVLGAIRSVTVSRSCNRWYASIQTEREVCVPERQGTAVGVDVGIVRFATLSDGTVYAPLHSFKRHQERLRRGADEPEPENETQPQLAQGQSARTAHLRSYRQRPPRLLAQMLDCRQPESRDGVHRGSARVQHGRVGKGYGRESGDERRCQVGLNRAILDQGWSEFRRQLEYKQAWSGGWLIAVPPHNTSQTCPRCGLVAKENRPSQARFACVCCGLEDHADLVAATNIRRAGHARIACEVNGTHKPSAAGTHRSELLGPVRGRRRNPRPLGRGGCQRSLPGTADSCTEPVGIVEATNCIAPSEKGIQKSGLTLKLSHYDQRQGTGTDANMC